jgi:hypothetical protein
MPARRTSEVNQLTAGKDGSKTWIKLNLEQASTRMTEIKNFGTSYRNTELIFGITISGWYASRATFGEKEIIPQHEHDGTYRHHYKLVIASHVPNGTYSFYNEKTPMSLTISSEENPIIDVLTHTHWANSQSWDHCEIFALNIQKGWFFIDGEDVYENTVKIINENKKSRSFELSQKFNAAKTAVIEAGFCEEDIAILIKVAPKGKVINLLVAVSVIVQDGISTEAIIRICETLKGENPSVVQNYVEIYKKADQLTKKTSSKYK